MGPEYDLLSGANQQRLLDLARTVDLVHIGPPCSSFSGARRGKLGFPGGPLRSKQYPMGLSGLSDIDANKVHVGNALVKFTCRVIALCCACRIPVTVENPRRSRLWWCPCMLRQLRFGHKINLDFCAYGADWQKATTFAVWNSVCFDDLGITCHGSRSKRGWCCGFSKKPHRVLEGSAPGGLNWTLIAQAYPHALASQYGFLANREFLNRQIHDVTANLWCARVHQKP
jgi:hypothetical protein